MLALGKIVDRTIRSATEAEIFLTKDYVRICSAFKGSKKEGLKLVKGVWKELEQDSGIKELWMYLSFR